METPKQIAQIREIKSNSIGLGYCPYGRQDICKYHGRCPEQVEICERYNLFVKESRKNIQGN